MNLKALFILHILFGIPIAIVIGYRIYINKPKDKKFIQIMPYLIPLFIIFSLFSLELIPLAMIFTKKLQQKLTEKIDELEQHESN